MESNHRGPDSSMLRSIVDTDMIFGFHRLAIMDMSNHGDQPFYSDAGNVVVCNGEIYNHNAIRKYNDIQTGSGSDCSVLLPLYEKVGLKKMVETLDGDFAFILYDATTKTVHVGRDPVGVKPLFWADVAGQLFIASEMKSIEPFCRNYSGIKIHMVPSGSTISFTQDAENMNMIRHHIRYYWHAPAPLSLEMPVPTQPLQTSLKNIHVQIRDKLTGAVKKRLMADRPLGLFISGGLDSSLIAAITRKLLPKKTIQSFSIGMPGSPDLEKAQIVADYLKTEHHPFYFTPEQGITAVRDVIRQLETYDITTIRASTPQYLLSQYVQKNTDVKVVLSGEGSDELFGGYLYFHRTPSNTAFDGETRKLIRELECYDVLRTDRTTAGNGLEVRVPFLDRGFMKYVMALPGSVKNPNASCGLEYGASMEKKLLRDAFSVSSAGSEYLPESILYRTKDAFSDACGYDWIPTLRAHCESQVSDDEFERRAEIYPHLTPTTKEAFYYRRVFEEFYPGQEHILQHYWLPNWVESKVAEPSAKILKLL